MPSLFSPPSNCWRVEPAEDFAILVDADDYFAVARNAIKAARRSIFLVGWDFDASITLGHPDVADGAPRSVGDFLLWVAKQNPDLEIRLLLWNPGFFGSWAKIANIPYLLRWKWHRQITVLLDGRHPVGSSHHQKILVIDDNVAFCGGIDVTTDRWDTRGHHDHEPNRRRPSGVFYGPWHDITSFCRGAAARALGDLCRLRWKQAGGETLAATDQPPPALELEGAHRFGGVALAISRSAPAYDGREACVEIERLYIDMIMAARRTIYAESQYFASRAVAQALARRLSEPDGPEVILINPVKADNWLGSLAMDTARARLQESLRRHDTNGRFRIFHPVTANGTPIYVHSKIMIVDDRLLRIGSSNFNNRSMRFDNECDVATDAEGNIELSRSLLRFRNDLLAEHLGVSLEEVENAVETHNNVIAAIDELKRWHQTSGERRKTLVEYETPELSDLDEWLADNEILDPEGPEAVFEPIEKRGLFRGRLKLPKRER